MGEHARYIDQDGVNVVLVHVDIADPQETADVENNLYAQLFVVPSPTSTSPLHTSFLPLLSLSGSFPGGADDCMVKPTSRRKEPSPVLPHEPEAFRWGRGRDGVL